ncbi:MAG: SH3 domain-containing protein [Hyphomicrobiaceae bacterium]
MLPHLPRRAAAAVLLAASLSASAQTSEQRIGPSGLPLPRYASLKADRVSLHNGPGSQYPAAWVFRRTGLPVEVIDEAEGGWFHVRDADGTTGWVPRALLSNRRTALVVAGETKAGAPPMQIPLRRNDRDDAPTIAMIETGVVANIKSCNGVLCLVAIEDMRGYLEQKNLWGVRAGEVIK